MTMRGAGFHGFDHGEYIDVMDKYGIDIGVLPIPAAESRNQAGRALWSYAGSSMTRSPKPTRNIPSDLGVRAAADGSTWTIAYASWSAVTKTFICTA